MEVKATQLQLPWEVSESTSQLLTVFRGEVKKKWVLQKHLKCLAWKASVKCVASRLLFLSRQTFPPPVHGTWIFPQGRMSSSSRDSSSSLPKPFHTHHAQKIFAGFSQISFWRDQSLLLLLVSFHLFVCRSLFSLSKRSQQSMSNKSAWSNIISAPCLVQPGQEITRRHDRTELAVWLNQKKLKPHWLLFWALSFAGVLY